MTHVDRLAELSDHGASIWLDSFNRERLRGGGLTALVRDRHVVEVTTDPTIFRQAPASGAQYRSERPPASVAVEVIIVPGAVPPPEY
jgi:transaldolase